MRIQNISSFANVICRFVVDATQMLRSNLPSSRWHLKSSAGSRPGGNPRKDCLFGISMNANDGPAKSIAQILSLLFGPTMQPVLVTNSGLAVRAPQRSTSYSQFEQVVTAASEHQRHR